MIEIGDKKIYIGDFHTHWYWDKENPTLFISGMYNLGYDFVLLCDGYSESKKLDDFCKIYEIPFRVFPGREIGTENAHIVVWIDEKFESYIDKIPSINPYQFLRDKVKLIIFAHPDKNWKDSFDGSFNPLINLYKEKLIDAIQPQHYLPYKIFEEKKLKISVVGGFDIHTCNPFIRYPFFLFNKNFPPFKHINPCSKYATVIIADNLDEKSIINSIKNSLSVSYDIEKGEFIGDREMVDFLIENGFLMKFKEEQRKRGNINLKGHIFAGEEGSVSIKGLKKVKYFIIPSKSLYEAKRVKKLDKMRLPNILNRENYYIPLTIKNERTNFYGVLVKMPFEMKVNSVVKKEKNEYKPFIEIILKNRTQKKKKLCLKIGFEEEMKEYFFVLNKKRKFLVPVNIGDFGIEYKLNLELKGKEFHWKQDLKIAFPICKYNENPWQIDKKTSIKIIKENIYGIENWKGEDDFSGEINLYWDRENFYLYAEIKDDIFYQKWTDWETFWGDSIQFAFGPYLKKIDSYGFNYELIISKTEKGNEIFIWNEFGKMEQVRRLYKEGYLDVIRNDKRTIYKLKIPWKFFKEFKVKENNRFLFSLIVFDNDGIIMKRKWFYFGENIAVRKSMKNAHSVTLLK